MNEPNQTYYLIDKQLNSRMLTDYLSRAGTWLDTGLVSAGAGSGEVWGSQDGPPLPITPDGQIVPGVLYPSSSDPQTRCYLPSYALNMADGRYTTSLKWRDKDADPNGPLAFLTLDVIGQVPVAQSGITVLAIPHQALARIAYQMPVQGGDARPAMWIEVGPLTRPHHHCGYHHRYGWGVLRAVLPISDKRDFDRLYQVMTDTGFNARLEIHCFSDALRRTWRQVVIGRPDLDTQKLVLNQKQVLFTNLLPSKVLQQPMAVAASNANNRTVKLDQPPQKRIGLNEALQLTNADLMELARKAADPQATKGPAEIHISAELDSLRRLSPKLSDLTTGERTLTVVPPVAHPVASPMSTSLHSISTATRIAVSPAPTATPAAPALTTISTHVLNEILLQPTLMHAFSRPISESLADSDIHTTVSNLSSKAVPLSAYIDSHGSPALIRISVETPEAIAPFSFAVDTNAYMFDIPDDMRPGSNHILIRMEVRDGSGQVRGVFFQDSAFTNQFYYQPQEFRLPRLSSPPFLPDLRIVFFDLVAQTEAGGGDQAVLNYKVQLAYRATPYIDPVLLDLVQQQVPEVQARFNALAPENTTFSLRLPADESGGALTDVPRPGVEVRFDQGIVDQIELSRTEFERIFAFFQSPSGVGLDGEVEAALLGSLTTRVPVHLSLKEFAGSVLSHTYLGPVDGGLHRVRLVNPIESPVTINALYRVTLGNGVFAFPQSAVGAVLPPGSQFDLDYRLEPASASVADISPALSVSIDVDPLRLWPQLFINQGYTSETFMVTPSTLPDFFGVVPPSGGEPLTSILVEFDEGTNVTLTAARLQAEVYLRIPLLPRLLGDAQAKKFRYRVTNLHGADAHPGDKSDWANGEGEGSLTITPAGA